MSTRTLSFLQWFGILAGAGMWATQHVVGYGVGEAACSAGGLHWRLDYDRWQYVLGAVSCAVFALAEASAAVVFLRTRGEDVGDGPPENGRPWEVIARRSRWHFFATAALVTNLLFFTVPLLDSLGSVFSVLCRQS
ncbi:MAG TPA: hypothetical protein VHD91_08140 [Gaiellaceae bacterium]|nr:hypothetical protein [Gaiellaceae bacterium]